MEEILETRIYDVQGTTKLNIYDGGFPQPKSKLEFFGNISSAPLGKVKIERIHIKDTYEMPDGKKLPLDYERIYVTVAQSSKEEELDVYIAGKYYPQFCKAEYNLNCETAHFDIETKFGSDSFDTGADGYYGHLIQMKQYHGMFLELDFAGDLFTIDEIETRMLKLWPKVKIRTKEPRERI